MHVLVFCVCHVYLRRLRFPVFVLYIAAPFGHRYMCKHDDVHFSSFLSIYTDTPTCISPRMPFSSLSDLAVSCEKDELGSVSSAFSTAALKNDVYEKFHWMDLYQVVARFGQTNVMVSNALFFSLS